MRSQIDREDELISYVALHKQDFRDPLLELESPTLHQTVRVLELMSVSVMDLEHFKPEILIRPLSKAPSEGNIGS